jgi:hypothetical protein
VTGCDNCYAVFGTTTRDEALKIVNLDEMTDLSFEEANPRYFDFTIDGVRTHGWYDNETKKVMQFG